MVDTLIYNNLNYNSIGIEIVNKGHKHGYQNFSKKQINSLILLCKNLKKKYLIKVENFLGHSDIAPQRKLDPGEKFPWKKLSEHKIGCWYKKNSIKKFNSNLKKEVAFFKNLKKIGYRYFNILKKGHKDKAIIKSFQRHYLPKNVSINLVKSIIYAKKVGAKIFGIVGRDGGETKKKGDNVILIPTIDKDLITPQTESFQSIIWHCLVSHPLLKVKKTKW